MTVDSFYNRPSPPSTTLLGVLGRKEVVVRKERWRPRYLRSMVRRRQVDVTGPATLRGPTTLTVMSPRVESWGRRSPTDPSPDVTLCLSWSKRHTTLDNSQPDISSEYRYLFWTRMGFPLRPRSQGNISPPAVRHNTTTTSTCFKGPLSLPPPITKMLFPLPSEISSLL